MTTPRFARALALAAALAATAAPLSNLHAQSAADVAAARDFFREGSQLAKDGKWLEARDRFERSLKLKRAAITLYSLGIAQQKTNQHVEALESFRAFLAEPPSAATEAYVAPTREAVIELEKRVARIAVKVTPAAATGLVIAIDGNPIPETALDRPRLVNAGTREVSVRATGYKPGKQSVTVAEGGVAEVTFTLVEDPNAKAEPAPLVPVAPTPTSTAGPGPAPAPDAPSRVVPISLIGGGTALLAGGLVIGLLGYSQAGDAPTRDGSDADSARTKGLVGDVLMGAGLVAVAAGVIVWVVQSPSKPAPATTGRLQF